jgi:hypothetical protein
MNVMLDTKWNIFGSSKYKVKKGAGEKMKMVEGAEF